MTREDTELGSEVKLTPPDEVQSFHLQHLPHPQLHGTQTATFTRALRDTVKRRHLFIGIIAKNITLLFRTIS